MSAVDPGRGGGGESPGLLGAWFETPPPLGEVTRLGGYELLEEVASGGMGVVWRARQVGLGRVVALKTIRSAHLATAEDVARFRAEATAAAALRHPAIVTVHELGEEDGRHYFTMELVEGPSLARKLRDGPLPAVVSAEILREIAGAVAFAHRQGILHRDLKPSNILLRPDGRPSVTDFGLARALGGDSEVTRPGTVLGSPSYLSPEQAQGWTDRLDARSDVYGLGAILYECLTGEAPFRGESALQTLRYVVANEPIEPRERRPDIPGDLNTICLRCLAKDPARRYATAEALAEDLGRFLRHEPIVARPVGWPGRLGRWSRRNRALAGSLAVMLGLAGVGAGAVVHQWRRAVAGELAARRADYDTAMFLANAAVRDRRFGLARESLARTRPAPEEEDLRAWEWHYLARRTASDEEATLGRHGDVVEAVAVSEDGRWVVSGAADGTVGLWALEGRRGVGMRSMGAGVRQVRFAPGGRRVGVSLADDTVRVLGVGPGLGEERLIRTGAGVHAFQFSEDGEVLWVAGPERVTRWEVGTGLLAGGQPVPRNGAALVVPALGRGVYVTPTNTLVFELGPGDFRAPRPFPEGRYLCGLFHSGDGSRVVAGYNDGTAWLWDGVRGEPMWVLAGHLEGVSAAAVEAVEAGAGAGAVAGRLATGSADESIVLWEAGTGQELDRLQGHSGAVKCLAFVPGGGELVSGGRDGTVRLWSTRRRHGERVSRGLMPGYQRASAAREGGHVFQVFQGGRCVVTRLVDPPEVVSEWVEPGLRFAALSPDAARMAVCLEGGAWEIRERRGGEYVMARRVEVDVGGVDQAVFSPRGEWLVVLAADGSGVVRDAWTLSEAGRFRLPPGFVGSLRVIQVLPDSRRLLVGHATAGAALLDWREGRVLAAIPAGAHPLMGAAASPDGRRMAVVFEGQPVALWETPSAGAPRWVRTLPPGLSQPRSVGYSFDGRRLAVGAEGGTVTVYNAETLNPVVDFKPNALPVYNVWFTADDRFLVTASPAAIARWEAARPEPGKGSGAEPE